MFNYRLIFRILGTLLLFLSLILGVAALVSYQYQSTDIHSFLISGLITFSLGIILWAINSKSAWKLEKRDAFLLVLLSWVTFSWFGSLPYLFHTNFQSITNSIFESVSGFTTTGISSFDDIESLPKGILFWRAQTQWIGGMGSILFAFIILPFLNIGGIESFSTEGYGISFLKLTPKLSQTMLRLLMVYVFLTTAAAILLWHAGMDGFDAICHAMSTVSTGGFSTKNMNIAHFNNPTIDYIIIGFMFLSGVNYSLLYLSLILKLRPLYKNEEVIYYVSFTLFFALLIFSTLLPHSNNLEQTFRNSVFTALSILTTTGFLNTDPNVWPVIMHNLVFLMLFFGSSTGTTTGGLKIYRIVSIVKNTYYEMKRALHPKAVIPLRINKKNFSEETVSEIILFVLLFIGIYAIGVVMLVFDNMDFETALGSSLTALCNVGPGIGKVVNPAGYANVPMFSKWVLSLLMLIGRLEIFTVLIVFTPQFRKL